MTSMLFRIWIWARSDIGSTAPTNLPDSMSMSEGMPSSDGFSRLLRKLAKGDLLLNPSRHACGVTLIEGVDRKDTRYTESIPYAFPTKGLPLSHCFGCVIIDSVRAPEAEEALQDNETIRD